MNPKPILLLLLLSSTARAATYRDLVSHLTNLQLLAKLPEPGEKTPSPPATIAPANTIPPSLELITGGR